MTQTALRQAELKQMLTDRRQDILDRVQEHLRDGRAGRASGVGDSLDHADAGMQGDIELALLQMQTETLARIEQALVRLDDGRYGCCAACGKDVSQRRLRALPFAIRCQTCEEHREQELRHARLASRQDGASLFADAGVV